MLTLGLNLGYGLLLATLIGLLIPALIILEDCRFSGSFRQPVKGTKPLLAYRLFLKSLRIGLSRSAGAFPLSAQIINLAETALLLGLWLVLPYQMQVSETSGLLWLYLIALVVPVNAIIFIITASRMERDIDRAGALKNGMMVLSCYIPIIFSILIISIVSPDENLVALSHSQHGFWLGIIPRWNIFRSPFLFLAGGLFCANLIILLRINDGGFKPLEFQHLSEIYRGRRMVFGNVLRFNRQALYFSLAAMWVFMFMGGWQSPLNYINHHFASVVGGLWFVCKTVIIFMTCITLKSRLPTLIVKQVLGFNFIIQVPVLTLIWLSIMAGRWF